MVLVAPIVRVALKVENVLFGVVEIPPSLSVAPSLTVIVPPATVRLRVCAAASRVPLRMLRSATIEVAAANVNVPDALLTIRLLNVVASLIVWAPGPLKVTEEPVAGVNVPLFVKDPPMVSGPAGANPPDPIATFPATVTDPLLAMVRRRRS